MVNSMDLGRGFLKLQEDNQSRRSSSLFRQQKPLELNENGIHYVTRINCGCGKCVPFRVKVERDDGGLRIGKLTLATNCHLIIVIFGFFFLIAGSVLTALAYKEPVVDDDDPNQHGRASNDQINSTSRQEGKIAGPIFIIIGSALVLIGFTLAILSCKLNREAKRQLHMSRFTWETPPIQTPDIFNNSQHHSTTSSEHFATFGNNLDSYSVRSRESCSSGSGNRRDSSFTFSRHNAPAPLTTIAQAVPVGVFLFGGDSTSPTIQVTDPSGFQEVELGSPTTESAPTSAPAFSRSFSANYSNLNPPFRKQHRSKSASDGSGDDTTGNEGKRNPTPNESTGQSKVNLGLRPSLPIIPMFSSSTSPHYFSRNVTPLDARNLYVSSRSDEPFGSIASLSTSGDIACFPNTSPFPTPLASTMTGNESATNPGGIGSVMEPTPEECDEDQSTSTTVSVPSVTLVPTGETGRVSSGNPEKYNNNPSNTIANMKLASNKVSALDNEENWRNDVNSSNKNEDSEGHVISSTSSPSHYNHSISELPPININERGERKAKSRSGEGVGGGGFPKSILKESKSEQVTTTHAHHFHQKDGNNVGQNVRTD